MPQPMEVLGAMITPAVLISAAALILLFTVSRLGRVNDRLLHLVDDVEELASVQDVDFRFQRKLESCLVQLAGLQERLTLLRSAVTSLYATIALLIATSILIGVNVSIPALSTWVPICVGMIGAMTFLYSISLLIFEALLATRVTLHEVEYVKELLNRNQTRVSSRSEISAPNQICR